MYIKIATKKYGENKILYDIIFWYIYSLNLIKNKKKKQK